MERYLLAGLLITLTTTTVDGAASTTSSVDGGCGPCRCRQVQHQYIVDCSYLGLVHPPASLPSNLTELSLRGNRIFNIDAAYFQQFPFLTTLDISSNLELGFDNTSVSFMGLRHSKISFLNMSAIVKEFSDKAVILTRKHFHFLKETQLKEIYMDWNWIYIMEPSVYTEFPVSLEVLSMRRSRLVFTPALIISLFDMKNLRKIDLTYRNVGMTILKRQRRSGHPRGDNYVATPTVHLPPKLEELVLNRSGFWTTIPRMHFAPNRLKRLVISQMKVNPVIGPVIGLDELEEIDLTESGCKIVPADMSNVLRFPKLKRLYMKQNSLDLSTKEHIFDYWNELSVLDISFNKISIIPTGVFRSLTNLTNLNLRANIIYEFRVDIAHMTQLKTLDIADNKIVFLSANMTKQLETINNVSNLTLHLSGNPIQCSCDKPKLEFVQWLVRTRVNIAKRSVLKCSTAYSAEGEQIVVDFLDQLEERCRSKTNYYVLTLCSAVLVTLGLCFVVFGILYRYRYKLIYFYFTQRHKYNRVAVEDEGDINNRLEFDAYVAYADQDRHFGVHVLREYLEKQGNIRLCFRDRDILPGEVFASGIFTAMTSSRRVILVLSPDFLRNSWRQYELQMAVHEEIERGGNNIIIIIKLGELPLQAVTHEMIHMMHTKPCLEFPRLEEDQPDFWNTLREVLNS